MIKKLSIKNFKSMKDLKIDCRRVNLFIGEPNTGKSNILEALGLLSWCGHLNTDLGEYVRIQGAQNLFYDDLLDQTVEIGIENGIRVSTKIKFENDNFHFDYEIILRDGEPIREINIVNYSGESSRAPCSELAFIKFYRFVRKHRFPETGPSFLMPPHGSNMFAVVMGNERLRRIMSRFFKEFGLHPILRPREKTFEVQRQMKDTAFSCPYILAPDTLQSKRR